MLKVPVILVVLAALALPGALLAHEGHEHKVMGTVVQVHTDKVSHVEVKTTDGKTVILTCDDQTRFLKGKSAASLEDVKEGSRIVATVTTEGKTTKASEIQIGEGGGTAHADEPHHHR